MDGIDHLTRTYIGKTRRSGGAALGSLLLIWFDVCIGDVLKISPSDFGQGEIPSNFTLEIIKIYTRA
jgi:hypothetical protein